MSTSSHLRPLLVGALLLGAAAGQAFAATVSYTATSSTSTAINTNWNGTLIIPRFNATLGTLTKVSLVLSLSMTSSISIENTGVDPSSGHASTELTLSVSNVTAGINVLPPYTAYNSATFYFSGLLSNTTTSSGPLYGTAIDVNKDYTGSSQLNAFTTFTGPDNITLDTAAVTAVSSVIGGSFTADQSSQANLTGYVTYTYNVPEPACLGALAAGLCLTLRRRRQ